MTKAVNNAVKEKPEPIDNTELVDVFRAVGGQILHIPPRTFLNRPSTKGMTLAYIRKGQRVELATAVTHRADQFCKKNGTKVAIEHFNTGRHVTIPVIEKTNSGIHNELRNMFGQFAYGW